MKTRKWVVVTLIAMAALACRNRESTMTGGFGSSAISGQVVLVGDLAGSDAAGIEVSVPGTGLSVMTDAEGRFGMFGVPSDDIDVRFRRQADGLDVGLRTPGSIGSLGVIEISSNGASRSRRRGVGHPGVEIEGTVVTVSADTMTILDSHGNEVTVKIDEHTILRHGNRKLTIADFEEGDHVHVKARRLEDGSLMAMEIKRSEDEDENEGEEEEDPTVTANGDVIFVGTDHVMVRTANGREIRVNVDENTRIKRQGREIALSDIEVNDRIEAQGKRVDDTTILAKKIEIEPGQNNRR